jgi:hypothetical protein
MSKQMLSYAAFQSGIVGLLIVLKVMTSGPYLLGTRAGRISGWY